MNHDELELRQAFLRLRAEDAQQVDSFEDYCTRAARGRTPVRATRSRLFTAFAGATLMVWGLYLLLRPAPPPPVSISEWRAPTDVLLRGSGTSLIGTTPQLGKPAYGNTTR